MLRVFIIVMAFFRLRRSHEERPRWHNDHLRAFRTVAKLLAGLVNQFLISHSSSLPSRSNRLPTLWLLLELDARKGRESRLPIDPGPLSWSSVDGGCEDACRGGQTGNFLAFGAYTSTLVLAALLLYGSR